jgi:hypothetical protein
MGLDRHTHVATTETLGLQLPPEDVAELVARQKEAVVVGAEVDVELVRTVDDHGYLKLA